MHPQYSHHLKIYEKKERKYNHILATLFQINNKLNSFQKNKLSRNSFFELKVSLIHMEFTRQNIDKLKSRKYLCHM